VTRDGSTIDVAASTTALRDDAGQTIGVVWVNRRRPPSPAPAPGALEGLGQEDLRRGMDERQFEVYYQPVVALDDSHVIGVEALIRWNHPQLGLLAPNAFLAVVETSGMMTELGGFVLEEACGQVAQWRRAGFDLELAVNISASQLAEPLLISRITAALSSSGLDAARLWLEVTETTLVQDVDKASDVLHLLVSDGLRIAIDDFGTGWASLTYLQRFPVHALKIDRSFVAGVDRNPHDVAIARSILSLGYELGLAVVAEGIESSLQHEALRLLGCSVGQGFLHGRPGPAAAVPLERAIRVEAAAQRGAERRRHRTQPMIGAPGAHTARTGGAATATSTLDSGSRGAPPGAGPFRDGLVADGELSGGVTAGTDAEAVVNLLRGLLRIGSARTAAELLHSAVRRLGATLVPASEAHPDALPVDVSLGEGPPLLAVAEPLSVTRMRLERILPRLVEDARHAIDLLRQTERLEEETQHDRLTGLANRRVLDRVLPRAGSGVVIMIDLDHFKRVNDTGGHAAGDAVLEGFGRLLVREVRATDTCCRVGGEEFVIVAADAEVSDALQLIGRIRAAWAKAAPQPVTFSAGVAAVSSPGGTSALLAADRALYRAKALGRDRTEVESDLGPEQ
jgi:diguanylate cyclase (GGDEF)-like protein